MVLEDETPPIEVPGQRTPMENLSFKKESQGRPSQIGLPNRCGPRLCHPSPGEPGTFLSLRQNLV